MYTIKVLYYDKKVYIKYMRTPECSMTKYGDLEGRESPCRRMLRGFHLFLKVLDRDIAGTSSRRNKRMEGAEK